MSSSYFMHEFDELPLFIAPHGYEAAFISVQVEIELDSDGSHKIAALHFDCYPKRGRRKQVELTADHPLHAIVMSVLTGPYAQQVQDAVDEQLESARQDAEDARADYLIQQRRDARMFGEV